MHKATEVIEDAPQKPENIKRKAKAILIEKIASGLGHSNFSVDEMTLVETGNGYEINLDISIDKDSVRDVNEEITMEEYNDNLTLNHDEATKIISKAIGDTVKEIPQIAIGED